MNTEEKKYFIQNHLDQVEEPVIDDIYQKVLAFVRESLIEESEEDIKNGNVISHQALKKEVLNWRPTK